MAEAITKPDEWRCGCCESISDEDIVLGMATRHLAVSDQRGCRNVELPAWVGGCIIQDATQNSKRNEWNARNENSLMLHKMYCAKMLSSSTSTNNVFSSFLAGVRSCKLECWKLLGQKFAAADDESLIGSQEDILERGG